MIRTCCAALVALGSLLAGSAAYAGDTVSSASFPDEATTREELRRFVEVHRGGPGVVVGLLDASGRRVVAFGESGRRERPTLDGATRFEIGSITKTFTGALLADMLLAGEVSVDTRVATLFPPTIALDNGAGQTTLEALATHTSGLPRLAVDLRSLSRLFASDPYRGSSADEIFHAVAKLRAPIRPTETLVYSNLGFGLLGRLLERRAAVPYELLLRRRVLEPLGLGGMATAHSDPPPVELARGHGPGGRPAPYWHVDGYAPAGCLLGSTDELLDYLARLLAGDRPALVEASRERRRFPDGSGIGLAWMHNTVGGHRLVWHNGGTGGFRSFAGFLPDEGRALVVLANGQGDADALARRLLDPSEPPLPAYDAGSIGLALTILLLAWGPLLLVVSIREASKATRAPAAVDAAEAAPPPARKQRLKIDRFDVLRRPLSPVIALLLAERMGAWLEVPFATWWLALAIAVATYALLVWKTRRLPWLRPGPWRAAGRALGSLFELGVIALLLA